jgi:ATP/ADP translocase
MSERLLRVLGLGREDERVLLLCGPLFAIATAVSIIVSSFTKALFLSAHPLSHLPWMFLGSGLFTAGASILYVMAMERVALHHRFMGLLALAVTSFSGLRLIYDVSEEWMSLVMFIWCGGIGHLVIIQTWNMASGLLPARQGKRLFPIFAAISTIGAAAGGGLTPVMLNFRLPTQDLVWLAVALLILPLFTVRRVIRELGGALPTVGGVERDVLMNAQKAKGMTKMSGSSEVSKGLASLRESPLLFRLALFVFLMQVASVMIDYQFSAELAAFGKEKIAGFLGKYYLIANLLTFVIALAASSRLVRTVGIGLAIASTAVVIALGSAAYLGATITGAYPAFWAIAGVSFFERVTSFALSKNAMQMLVTPIETRKGERAKTLIDGVIYRLATLAVSVVVLFMLPADPAEALEFLRWMSPAAIIASVAVVMVAVKIGPHYRRTLFEALRARRLDTSGDPQLREWVARTAIAEVKERLSKGGKEDALKALEIIRDLKVPIDAATLETLIQHSDSQVAQRALETMNMLEQVPSQKALVAHLRHESPAVLLREVLRMLDQHHPDPDLIARVGPFVQHRDPGVASLALIWMKKVAGHKRTMDIHNNLLADIQSDDPDRRARATAMAGQTGWAQAAQDLPNMVEDGNLQVRRNAVEAMGQVGLPEYIDPLIIALGRGDLADRALTALMRYGHKLVDEVEMRLEEGKLSLATKIRLIRVVEGIASGDALDLLMKAVVSTSPAIRNQAVLSMWRMARDPSQPVPPKEWVAGRLLNEIRLLDKYLSVLRLVAGEGKRSEFFIAEINALRLQAETRAFRLLGLMYQRAAMYRAYMNYRSGGKRTRSNAIELLDQHVRDPELRELVVLIEQGLDVRPPDPDETSLDGVETEVARLLGTDAPWLLRVWSWATKTVDLPRIMISQTGTTVKNDPMDMVFLLKGVPLFTGLSGEQLLPVADIAHRVTFEKGDIVFEQGHPGLHVYLILDGEVEVIHDGDRVATLGEKQCFGEMALLDQGERSASIRCTDDVELLAISRDDFQDLLDLYPALAKGIIRTLTQRLRVANDAQRQEQEARRL